MHTWWSKKYSFGFVLSRLTILVGMDKIREKCSFRMRLVGLISTKTKKYFFGCPLHCMHLVYMHFACILCLQILASECKLNSIFITPLLYCRDAILKSIEKKLNSSDLNDYDLLVAASIYFNEQVSGSCSTNSYLCSAWLEFDLLNSDLYSCCLNHNLSYTIT